MANNSLSFHIFVTFFLVFSRHAYMTTRQTDRRTRTNGQTDEWTDRQKRKLKKFLFSSVWREREKRIRGARCKKVKCRWRTLISLQGLREIDEFVARESIRLPRNRILENWWRVLSRITRSLEFKFYTTRGSMIEIQRKLWGLFSVSFFVER